MRRRSLLFNKDYWDVISHFSSSIKVIGTNNVANNFEAIEINGVLVDEISTSVTAPSDSVVKYKLSNNSTTIPSSAFSQCYYMDRVEISDKITNIGSYAFSNCNIRRLEISKNITQVYGSSFMGCGNLATITVDNDNAKYDSRNNCNGIIEKSTNTLVVGGSGMVIPNTVTKIGDDAFDGRSITNITIPANVTDIGSGAFAAGRISTSSSINVTFASGSKLKTIGNYAFNGRGFTSFTIPSGVTSVGSYAFWYCSYLESINIPSGLTEISSSCFCDCSSLTSVTIANGSKLNTIGVSAFTNCRSMVEINFPNTLTTILQNAFYGCSVLKRINSDSVDGELDFPPNIKRLDAECFRYCHSIVKVDLPDTVTGLTGWAFANCTSMTSFTIRAITPPTNGYKIVASSASGRKIYVPSGSVDAYKAASGWSEYASSIKPIS